MTASNKLHLVVDLAKLKLIDSSGVGAIVCLLKRVRVQNGDVKISNLGGQPYEIFKLLRLDRAFDIHDSVDSAVERFQKSA